MIQAPGGGVNSGSLRSFSFIYFNFTTELLRLFTTCVCYQKGKIQQRSQFFLCFLKMVMTQQLFVTTFIPAVPPALSAQFYKTFTNVCP
jgi:hypothetical protein